MSLSARLGHLPAPRVHVLNPGDTVIAGRGERIDTLLGSCVAVLLDDARGTVGAMCHIVHASEPGPAERANTAFATPALAALGAGLQARGLVARLCRARVYGGANLFPHLYGPGHVGQANVQRVFDWLDGAGIPVLSQSVGGTGYRKISWRVGVADPHCEVVEGGALTPPSLP